MKYRLTANLLLIILIGMNADCMPEEASDTIKLTRAPIERTAGYAVWRTDVYICTGIAYAKSVGKSPDDFTNFVAETHGESLKPLEGKGLEPIVQLLHFIVTNYPNGTFEIISESEKTVNVRFNRPYSEYFKDGDILGVSLDEFEKCLWGHARIIFGSIGVYFEYHVKDDLIEGRLSIRE